MTALELLKKHWYWAGLLVLGGAIATAALIAPSDMSRHLTVLTLLLLGAGVALHPALALILDRERDVQPSSREQHDAPPASPIPTSSATTARGPWASCVLRSTGASSSLSTSLNSILPPDINAVSKP